MPDLPVPTETEQRAGEDVLIAITIRLILFIAVRRKQFPSN